MTCCRFPACRKETGGRDAVFCVDHHLACTHDEAAFLLRISIASRRTECAETRDYLREQLTGYVNVAIHNITERQNEAKHVA
ncbi:MAG: hypothetical protein P1V13_22335 [Rhizobiaceae bacterium]|nr:hypothetical protein [Rhizobiaceae bacterium]